MSRFELVVLAGLATSGLTGLTSCSSQASRDPHGVRISVAPLSLPGIGGACYDLEVSNGTDVVWSQGVSTRTLLGASQALDNGPFDTLDQTEDAATICSGEFGSGRGGDITYIGSCDASTDSDGDLLNGVQNLVTIWVDGLYNDAGVADVGEWRDPCPPQGCQLQIDCRENEDSLAEFNFTIMRAARQGFFDIAVDFQDVFCSAKLDTCYEHEAGPQDDEHIELLFGAGGGRDWTGVFAFACTAGVDTATHDVRTNLLYSAVTIACGDNIFRLDPTQPEGNREALGTLGGSIHYGIYRGTEELKCDGESCNKVYWNIAVSLDDLEVIGGGCALALEATVNDNNDGFTLGLPTAVGLAYPYVVVAADLTLAGEAFCQQNPLNSGNSVRTDYRGNLVGQPPPATMCHQYDGLVASSTGADVGCSSYITDAGMTTLGPVSGQDPSLLPGSGVTDLGFTLVDPLTNGTNTNLESSVRVIRSNPDPLRISLRHDSKIQ